MYILKAFCKDVKQLVGLIQKSDSFLKTNFVVSPKEKVIVIVGT